MPVLLILWWSRTGACRSLAAAAAEGAATESAVSVRSLRCDQADTSDLLSANGLLFVFPEMLGSMAGMMKDFIDRTYYDGLDQLNGRPYDCFIGAGSDGQGARRQFERIAAGWRLRAVAPTLIVSTHAQTPERILAPKALDARSSALAHERGAALAAGLALGVW